MKKRIIPKTAAFAMAAFLALPVTVCAAPPAAAPIEMSVKQDGKAHNVYVFGQSLALISTDGSIEISCMGSVGRVDVMIDGVLTKNVASIDIPASQKTKMVLDENSIIVKNVTAESGKAVKKQISDAYASGAASINLASLSGVTAYKVNTDGQVEDSSGKAVTSNAIGVSVSSTEAAAVSFAEEMKEIEIAEQEAEAAILAAEAAASVSVPSNDDKEVSGGDNSGTTGGGTTGGGTTGGGTTGGEEGEEEGDDENKGGGGTGGGDKEDGKEEVK